MAPRARRRRPTLRHLFLLLFISLCVILTCLYCLNAYVAEPSSAFDSPREFFKADFRTVPHALQGGPRRLVVLVDSNWRNFDRRSAIRNSWASAHQRLNCSVFFVVGDSDDRGVAGVSEEGAFFHDVIQPAVLEHEQNRVLKLLAAFRFLEDAVDADFVMKTNDDVFVNLAAIVDYLRPYVSSFDRLIFGRRINVTKDDRSNLWPPYVSGSGYVVSFDVMKRFVLCPKLVDLLPREEIYFTGACRRHFGLALEHDEKFVDEPRVKLPCLWKSKFVTSNVQRDEMELIWNSINKETNC